jgi:HTH-type transcriptional regulator/antitoxin HigA
MEWYFMKGTHLPIQFAHLPKNYSGLCRLLTPRPIRNKVDLENVTGMTYALAGHKLTPDQEDYFDLLCRLVEDYEREQGGVSAPRITGLDALRHLLDEHGMSGADLSRLLGPHRTLGSMILRGERKLIVEHLRTLCTHFSVSGDLFL